MNAVARVQERLQRAMEGLLREFAADGTEPVNCEFVVQIDALGVIDISGGETKPVLSGRDSAGRSHPDDFLIGTPLDEWPSSETLPDKPKATKKKS